MPQAQGYQLIDIDGDDPIEVPIDATDAEISAIIRKLNPPVEKSPLDFGRDVVRGAVGQGGNILRGLRDIGGAAVDVFNKSLSPDPEMLPALLKGFGQGAVEGVKHAVTSPLEFQENITGIRASGDQPIGEKIGATATNIGAMALPFAPRGVRAMARGSKAAPGVIEAAEQLSRTGKVPSPEEVARAADQLYATGKPVPGSRVAGPVPTLEDALVDALNEARGVEARSSFLPPAIENVQPPMLSRGVPENMGRVGGRTSAPRARRRGAGAEEEVPGAATEIPPPLKTADRFTISPEQERSIRLLEELDQMSPLPNVGRGTFKEVVNEPPTLGDLRSEMGAGSTAADPRVMEAFQEAGIPATREAVQDITGTPTRWPQRKGEAELDDAFSRLIASEKGAIDFGGAWQGLKEKLGFGDPKDPISQDPYGLKEGPMDRRNFLFRGSGLSARAAKARTALSPGIVGRIAEEMAALGPETPIKIKGKTLAKLGDEGALLSQLHEKHGVLNENLSERWLQSKEGENSPELVLDEVSKILRGGNPEFGGAKEASAMAQAMSRSSVSKYRSELDAVRRAKHRTIIEPTPDAVLARAEMGPILDQFDAGMKPLRDRLSAEMDPLMDRYRAGETSLWDAEMGPLRDRFKVEAKPLRDQFEAEEKPLRDRSSKTQSKDLVDKPIEFAKRAIDEFKALSSSDRWRIPTDPTSLINTVRSTIKYLRKPTPGGHARRLAHKMPAHDASLVDRIKWYLEDYVPEMRAKDAQNEKASLTSKIDRIGGFDRALAEDMMRLELEGRGEGVVGHEIAETIANRLGFKLKDIQDRSMGTVNIAKPVDTNLGAGSSTLNAITKILGERGQLASRNKSRKLLGPSKPPRRPFRERIMDEEGVVGRKVSEEEFAEWLRNREAVESGELENTFKGIPGWKKVRGRDLKKAWEKVHGPIKRPKLLDDETGNIATDILKSAGRTANQLRVGSMLSGLALPKSLLGNLGAVGTASIERGSTAPIREMLRFPTNIREARTAWRENANPSNIHGAGPVNVPGRLIGTTDTVSQKLLERAGLSTDEAQRLLLTRRNAAGKSLGIDNPVGRVLWPFQKTPFNQLKEGMSGENWRTPKRVALSVGAGGAGALLGESTDDPRILGLAAALSGPRGLLTLLGAGFGGAGRNAIAGISPIPEWGIPSDLNGLIRLTGIEPAAIRAFGPRRVGGGRTDRTNRERTETRRER